MKRVFLSTSFSGQVHADTGEALPEFRASIEAVLQVLREQPDTAVFCAIEDEGWKLTVTPPDVGVHKDIQELAESDLLLALVQDQISAGVQFEIGYAVGKGIPVILAATASHALAYFNEGLVGAGYVTLITYEAPTDLVARLSDLLIAPAREYAA
jgi:hypothetical protein